MSSLLKKTFLRVIAFILASSIGAIVFSSLERSHAKNELKTKEKLLESLRKEMGLKYNMTQADFENFSQLSHDALSLGGPAWDYLDGLRFAFETLTTIGYGAISPSTTAGQALCIVFAVLGIPVTILAFQSVGELMSRGISCGIAKIEKQCFKREPSHVEAKCTVVTCVLMLTMLFCGAGMQIFSEDWTFLVGFYFWFITFTTIGYGDYIPDKKSRAPWKIAFQLTWTTLGLCVVSSVLNALAAFIEKRQQSTECSCYPHGNQELKDVDGYEKKMNESENSGIENNGREVCRVDCNGTGNSENQYDSVTYV